MVPALQADWSELHSSCSQPGAHLTAVQEAAWDQPPALLPPASLLSAPAPAQLMVRTGLLRGTIGLLLTGLAATSVNTVFTVLNIAHTPVSRKLEFFVAFFQRLFTPLLP